MNRSEQLKLKYTPLTLLIILLFQVSFSNAQPKQKPVNIVFILVDDMGYGDVGAFGSTFYETPNIDALASEGMKFMNSYTAGSICSPTRASIMTGKYPVRTGVTDWIPGQKVSNTKLIQPQNQIYLDSAEVTFAELLKKNGYATHYSGKWHLGEKEGLNPLSQGFDEWYNAKALKTTKSRLTTDSLTEHTLKFIQKKVAEKKPFLAYISYYDVHTPIYAYPDFIDKYKNKLSQLPAASPLITEGDGLTRASQDDPEYASMVGAVDKSVSAINELLKKLGIAENTVVIFTSDNGGLSTNRKGGPTSNLPLRAGKGWLYEGGIKVPLIIKYPGHIKPGTITNAVTMSTDFYPTFLQFAGLELRPDLHKDGISLTTLFNQNSPSLSRDVFWHYPHYHGSTWTPGAAVRSGDWKLIAFYETGKFELYNLKDDPYEKNDLSQSSQKVLSAMKSKLQNWQAEVKAKLPTQNAKYDPNLNLDKADSEDSES